MTIHRNILLNQLAQGIVGMAEGERWFAAFDLPAKREVLVAVAAMVLQAHPTFDEAVAAVAASGLRKTLTPCVLLARPDFMRKMGTIRNLREPELGNVLRLLLLLLGIADKRRRQTETPCGGRHWWHRDLRDPKVLADLREEVRRGFRSPPQPNGAPGQRPRVLPWLDRLIGMTRVGAVVACAAFGLVIGALLVVAALILGSFGRLELGPATSNEGWWPLAAALLAVPTVSMALIACAVSGRARRVPADARRAAAPQRPRTRPKLTGAELHAYLLELTALLDGCGEDKPAARVRRAILFAGGMASDFFEEAASVLSYVRKTSGDRLDEATRGRIGSMITAIRMQLSFGGG